MKLTDEQWEDIGSKLAPRMSIDDIKKVLTDSSYDYDDEDLEDLLSGVDVKESAPGNIADDKHLPLTDENAEILFDVDGQSITDPRFDETARFWFATPEDAIKNYGNEHADAIRKFYEEHPWEDDKPHDEELAGEKTPEEDFMQRAAAGQIPATSGVLAGDLTPEEIEMIQMMRAGKQPPKSKELAGETTPEEKEMLKLAESQTLSDERFKNITNRLAKNLSKHRW